MFGALKKNKEIPVYAPMNGVATALSDVPDEAFAEKCWATARLFCLTAARY